MPEAYHQEPVTLSTYKDGSEQDTTLIFKGQRCIHCTTALNQERFDCLDNRAFRFEPSKMESHMAKNAGLVAASFQAVNRINPTSYGRHSVASLATRLGGRPPQGPHNVGDGVIVDIAGSDYIETALYYRAFEYEIRQQFRTLLQRGHTVLDVGANVGYYSALASKLVTRDGHVYAVEPNPMMLPRLRSTIELNQLKNVEVLAVAAGNTTGRATLFLPTGHSHGEASLREQNWTAASAVDVDLMPLDSALRLDRLDLVKIDVEGAELSVLQGAVRLLRQYRPAIIVEIVPPFVRRFGAAATDVLAFVSDLGHYHLWKVGRHRVTRVRATALREEDIWGNFLCLPA